MLLCGRFFSGCILALLALAAIFAILENGSCRYIVTGLKYRAHIK
jgi:hypothetical protein